MVAPYQGWLYFQDAAGDLHELVNHARTLSYLRNSELGCATISFLTDVCPAFYLDINDAWAPMTFVTPSDAENPAPWWDGVADSPTSQAYGFWITEWTGLDGGHHSRSVQSRGTRGGGGVLGPLSSRQRVMALNVTLFGANECALDELFRWLESQLLALCDPCGTLGAFIRTCCPPEASPAYGVWSLDEVGLIEGPTFIQDVEGLTCMMRNVTFTLAAGSPCMFSLPTAILTDGTLDTGVVADACDYDAILGVTNDCATFAANRLVVTMPSMNVGVISPRIRITNAGDNYTAPLVVKTVTHVGGGSPDPCTEDIDSEMQFDALPPDSELLLDGSRNQILFRTPANADSWIDGSPFLVTDPNSAPTFPRFCAPNGYVLIEPLQILGDNSGLTIDVESQQRIGCTG